jgi:hypothetical protein
VVSPPPDQGITITFTDGSQRYLPAGTFVKVQSAPAIYVVYGGYLHAFSTWDQFLQAGGHSDLSNVIVFEWLQGPLGQPVHQQPDPRV